MRNRTYVFGAILVAVIAIGGVLIATLGGDDDTESATTTSAASTATPTDSSTESGSATSEPASAQGTEAPGDTDAASTTSPGSPPTQPSIPPTTVPTPPSTLPPAEDPDAGQEVLEPVPFGESIDLEGWRIGVSAAELDATETIVGHMPFNEEPPEGEQYVMVELSGVRTASSFGQPVFDFTVANADFVHEPEPNECGQIPDDIYGLEPVAPGRDMRGNLCFLVSSDQVNEELVLSLGLLDESGEERFFAIQEG